MIVRHILSPMLVALFAMAFKDERRIVATVYCVDVFAVGYHDVSHGRKCSCRCWYCVNDDILVNYCRRANDYRAVRSSGQAQVVYVTFTARFSDDISFRRIPSCTAVAYWLLRQVRSGQA